MTEPQSRAYMLTAKTAEWETLRDIFDSLNEEFSFTLDPAASPENAKCQLYFTKNDDGLTQPWTNHRVFLNPPYGIGLYAWIRKAYYETLRINGAEIVVALLPVRTDTKWFHAFILGKAEVRFLRGRVRFLINGQKSSGATFPSMIVIWRRK